MYSILIIKWENGDLNSSNKLFIDGKSSGLLLSFAKG